MFSAAKAIAEKESKTVCLGVVNHSSSPHVFLTATVATVAKVKMDSVSEPMLTDD